MNTRDKDSNMLKSLERIFVYILTAFLVFVLFASMVVRAEYCSYKYRDNPAWIRQDFFSLFIFIVLLLSVYLLINRLCHRFETSERRYIISLILLCSALVQTVFILILPVKQFADQDAVNKIAVDIIHGYFGHFQKGGYLYVFPNNVGITLLLSLLYRILSVPLLLPKLLNVLCSVITSYLTFRIYEHTIGENKRSETGGYAVLIFSSFFLPAILLNNLVYNDVYATTLFLGAVLNAIKYTKSKKSRYLIYTGILILAGDFLRRLGVIFIIAITIYFILKKVRFLKAFVFLIVAAICLRLPLFAVNTYFLATDKISEPLGKNSIPVYMWINIGMGQRKFGYWDDSFSYSKYFNEGEWNKEKSSEIYKSLIKKNIESNGISGIANTYLKKNIWLWTEGTYQAEYYGIGSWGYLYTTSATKLVENNRFLRDQVRWLLHGSNFLLLFLSLTGLIDSIFRKNIYPLILPVISILGFVGFYTIWEIKPRYIFPCYPYLILLSYYGLTIIYEKLLKPIKEMIKRRNLRYFTGNKY
ncbi:MAG: glycosyltransferase family 39 protein [Clostridiaceae bacterium]|nr:glycosyltransferase family 39 protein [Clostridiaceae bacterium]